ncbi:SAM-dependent methyltransferase [Heliophilum fasciatum]|nr:cyclopropane-fatty-acyl-phospholipid synthase family protein [Heliophilum fasciatum]
MLHTLCGYIEQGAFEVLFWDGTEEKYGEGPSFFKLMIRDRSVIGKLVKNPALVFGEAYTDGLIELDGQIDDVVRLLYLNKRLLDKITLGRTGQKINSLLRKVSIEKQKKDVQHHYDLGNDFFSLWLDPTMSYSCAYFQTPQDSLEQAQLQKIDYTLQKLQLQPGQRLLDIGSGWGWLIIRAAQHYGVKATGITVSHEQFAKAKQRIEEMQLEHLVDVKLMDYRELAKTGVHFDRIVSVGMFEHVGQVGMPLYMTAVKDMLTPGGVSLLHTITYTTEGPTNPWVEKYIFPGSYIPTLRETIWMLPDYDFHLLDVESLRIHYAMTLDRWAENFEQSLEQVREKYDDRFIRMWRMYLQSCAGSFRHSGLAVHQILFSKGLNNHLRLTREYTSV